MSACPESTPSPWLVEHAAAIPSRGPVLDLAAGGGRNARWLVGQGYRVVAVDRSTADLAAIASAMGSDRLEVRTVDLEIGEASLRDRLGALEPLAGIVVCNYLHRPLLPQLAGLLADDGVLLYDTFARGNESYGRPSNPDYLLEANELLRACLDGWTVIAFEHGFVPEPKAAVRQRIAARKGFRAHDS